MERDPEALDSMGNLPRRERLELLEIAPLFATAWAMADTEAGSFSGGDAFQRSRGFMTSHVFPSWMRPCLSAGIGMASDLEFHDPMLGDTPRFETVFLFFRLRSLANQLDI